MSSQRRVQLEPAYLLHHRPWSDTSRILVLLTRRRGRVTLFAHGARRPKSESLGIPDEKCTQPCGWIMIGVGLLMIASGFFAIQKIIAIEV